MLWSGQWTMDVNRLSEPRTSLSPLARNSSTLEALRVRGTGVRAMKRMGVATAQEAKQLAKINVIFMMETANVGDQTSAV